MIYLIMFIVGVCLGSFMNVVLSRNDWYSGRSRCDSCMYTLKWYDLIPIISYISLNGRCRRCGEKIGVLHLASEVFTGCGFAIASIYFTVDIMTAVTVITAVIFLCICAISDTKEKEVSILYLYGGIICLALLRLTNFVIQYRLIEAVKFFAVNGIIYGLFCIVSKKCMRYIGDGDFDILMILMLIVGFSNTVRCITIASIIGTCLYFPLVIVGKYSKNKPLPLAPLLYVGFIINIAGGGLC